MTTKIQIDAKSERIARVAKGINDQDAPSLAQLLNHVFNFNNPHNLTADKIQALSLAQNAHLRSDLDGEQLIVYCEVDGINRVVLQFGKLEVLNVLPLTYTYGIRGFDPYTDTDDDGFGNLTFEIIHNDGPYIANYSDLDYLEFELHKMNFMGLDWAQFAIFDTFINEDKRLNPDTSTNLAIIEKGRLTTSDNVFNKEFGFLSKIYSNITTVETGTSTSVASGKLTDSSKEWASAQFLSCVLKDSANNLFSINSSTSTELLVTGTPTAGAYSIKTLDPSKLYAMAHYSTTNNGGKGDVKIEATFNGTNWITLLDTQNSINELKKVISITNTGVVPQIRVTLKNDDEGFRPKLFNFMICFDPSIWRY